MSDPRAPWRSQVSVDWLALGQQVRDAFGDWWIAALPADEESFGSAMVEIAHAPGVLSERHVYLSEFLRDFEPEV